VKGDEKGMSLEVNDTTRGQVQVYTGNGKGKTTAAMGLALRAVGAGKRVYVGQFVKDMAYSETKVAKDLPGFHIEQLGIGCFIACDPTERDRQVALEALSRCEVVLKEGLYDVVVLDEVHIALYYKLIDERDLIAILETRAAHVEVVLTGRYAPDSIIEYADLVTEMVEIKHYYTKGILSRKGIDC